MKRYFSKVMPIMPPLDVGSVKYKFEAKAFWRDEQGNDHVAEELQIEYGVTDMQAYGKMDKKIKEFEARNTD